MANLAYGKMPLEERLWIDASRATDGISNQYNPGGRDFAHARHPTTFTIKLGGISEIVEIRFLLWDGAGSSGHSIRALRQYRYKLQLSDDDKTYRTWYSTQKNGFNGWQIFFFKEKVQARFVRLVCEHNTENDDFHIVEFEVYDGNPPSEPEQWRIGNREKLTEPEPSTIESFSEEKKAEINDIIAQLRAEFEDVKRNKEIVDTQLLTIKLFNENLAFESNANSHNDKARKWLIGAIVALLIFGSTVFMLFISDVMKNFTEVYAEVKDKNALPAIYF